MTPMKQQYSFKANVMLYDVTHSKKYLVIFILFFTLVPLLCRFTEPSKERNIHSRRSLFLQVLEGSINKLHTFILSQFFSGFFFFISGGSINLILCYLFFRAATISPSEVGRSLHLVMASSTQ